MGLWCRLFKLTHGLLNNFKQFDQHGGCLGFGGFRTSSNGFNQFSLVHGAP